MNQTEKDSIYQSAREKFLSLSLESTRKSYYPQLQRQLEITRQNERQLQLLIDAMPAWISYVDAQERYVLVNHEYEKTFGLKRSQIVGRHVSAILGTDNYAKVKNQLREALAGKHVHFESQMTADDGVIHWLDTTYLPDSDPQGSVKGLYALVLDITAKKNAEAEKNMLESKLRQVQKFEAIGTLAGGIAHDFNNLLMGIQGRSSLMWADIDASHPHREHIGAIEEYVRNAVHLTRQLLGFARGGKYETKPVDINELVLNSAAMFGRTRKEIRVHAKMNPTPLVVEADKSQIDQVLLNMYVNAWQAMPDGGDLYLESRAARLEEPYCSAHELTPGVYVRITVTDTGIGMDEATCQRVFDPFFTTKEKNRGTGLGLASAYGIVKNHGGVITVYSEKGQGATFNIYLPLTGQSVQPKEPAEEKIFEGEGTVLLVDDEEMILDVGKSMLERIGYRTVTAKGGDAAIKVFSEKKEEIDLVILDMIMPGTPGGKTFDQLRALRPDIPVILSSGYSLNGQAESILRRGCNGFIQKPYNISELSRKISEALKR